MNKFLFNLYRIAVPKPVRTSIRKRVLRSRILEHFSSLPENDINEEHRQVLKYLESNSLAIFPYNFTSSYSPENVEVLFDARNGMKYVMMENKRLYFKKRWSEKRIRKGYSDLMAEQDSDSPHRYLTDDFSVGSGDVVADIGAAEANFSLSIADKAKKIYIFECDTEWVEALNATFAPWKDKVEIISKRVSDHDDLQNIQFDTFFREKKDINFLKIDVDGAEQLVLNHCLSVLKAEGPMRIALCTYHKNNDEKDFTDLLLKNGFRVTPSKGYMIHYYDKAMRSPWLRRGLLRAVK
jgi:hypothetical protein